MAAATACVFIFAVKKDYFRNLARGPGRRWSLHNQRGPRAILGESG
jgi:hypothetical protein